MIERNKSEKKGKKDIGDGGRQVGVGEKIGGDFVSFFLLKDLSVNTGVNSDRDINTH